MNKVIAVIRTSTEKQEIDSQKKQLLEFIKHDNINSKNIIIIGEAGASAIKLDERYRHNLEKIYEYIKQGDISCIYAWSIDRIGRNEEVLMGFKNFLIEHKVNLKIVNPSLTLLNPDGTVNSGVELAFTLFATLSKQEMELKKERFARAKQRNREVGKFNGGGNNMILFGYKVDDGFIIPDESESEIVKMIFTMYSTGQYSIKKLSKELDERGIKSRCMLRPERLHKYLVNPIYCGKDEKKHYPAIISPELFDKCQALLKSNRLNFTREYKNTYFGTKLIKCQNCGHSLVCYQDHYKCAYHERHECDSTLSIQTPLMDGLLWHFAKQLELNMLLNQGKDDLQKYENELEIMKQKEKTLEEQSAIIDKKTFNTKQLYADAMITREQFDTLMAKHNASDKERKEKLLEIKENIKAVKSNINRIKQPDMYFKNLEDFSFTLTSLRDEKKMSEIVHRHIKSVEIKYTTDGKKGYEITINSLLGSIYIIRYYSHEKNGSRLFINNIPEKLKNYYIDRSKLKTALSSAL